jgi:hypothetical protein
VRGGSDEKNVVRPRAAGYDACVVPQGLPAHDGRNLGGAPCLRRGREEHVPDGQFRQSASKALAKQTSADDLHGADRSAPGAYPVRPSRRRSARSRMMQNPRKAAKRRKRRHEAVILRGGGTKRSRRIYKMLRILRLGAERHARPRFPLEKNEAISGKICAASETVQGSLAERQ